MLSPIELSDAQRSSLLGRTSALVKLAVALSWLVGLALTVEPLVPLALFGIAIAAGLTLGAIPPRILARGLAPLALAAVAIGLANLLFSGSNTDPFATQIARVGPFRVTREAADVAVGLGARVLAIVGVGVVFAQTTDPTLLVDSLVQQARIPERFAYGALAAYQAAPRLAEDLSSLRQARRVRGLRTVHPAILMGLLVRAIRHADQLALAMDARAFGSGPRTTFRPVRWSWRDVAIGLGGLAVLVVALQLA